MKNVVEAERTQMTIQYGTCWITKPTNTFRICNIVVFPRQQWLRQRPTILHCKYIASRVHISELPPFEISTKSLIILAEVFIVLFSPSRKPVGYRIKQCHDASFPNPFQVVIPFDAVQSSRTAIIVRWTKCVKAVGLPVSRRRADWAVASEPSIAPRATGTRPPVCAVDSMVCSRRPKAVENKASVSTPTYRHCTVQSPVHM
jgi:hypothetical protein